MPKQAAALIIGNELLSGKIQERNLAFLGEELYRLGIRLSRAVLCLDDVDTIAEELNALRHRFDYVFTSGGVGPTHDDMTLPAVAKAFGRPLVRSPELAELIRGHRADVTEAHLRMADVPEGARLIANADIRWPTVTVDNVFVCPGVPEIFRMKFAAVREHLEQGAVPFHSLAVYTLCDEGHIAALLERLEHSAAGVQVGSYPTFRSTDYQTKVTFDGHDLEQLRAIVAAFTAEIAPEQIVRIEG